jgi:hypothetical protein
MDAPKGDISPLGRGRFLVLSIWASLSFSMIWLNTMDALDIKKVASKVLKIRDKEGEESTPKYNPGSAVTRTKVVTLGLVSFIQICKKFFILGLL